jgi:hypothetical protein
MRRCAPEGTFLDSRVRGNDGGLRAVDLKTRRCAGRLSQEGLVQDNRLEFAWLAPTHARLPLVIPAQAGIQFVTSGPKGRQSKGCGASRRKVRSWIPAFAGMTTYLGGIGHGGAPVGLVPFSGYF